MRYLSVCSGIEAATVAWSPLGWEAVAFSEVEPFPCAVLAHHYPNVPNLGDMTSIEGSNFRETVELVVGGTPCQDFSVAGKRAGLAGERSGLALAYFNLLATIRPRWVVWENVPGVLSSNKGRDFGTILWLLAQLGYGFAYRVLDAQFFGVPQRRRRVFLVGYLGDWRPAAAVLFEPHSLCGHPAPRRKEKSDTAGAFTAGAYSGGAGGRPEGAAAGHFVPHVTQALTKSLGAGGADDNRAQAGFYVPEIVSQAMSCKWAKGTSGPAGDEHHNLIATSQYGDVAGALTARHDSSPCADRGMTVVALHEQAPGTSNIQLPRGRHECAPVCAPLTGAPWADNESQESKLVIAFHGSQDPDVSGTVTHPLGQNQGQETCIAIRTANTSSNGWGIAEDGTAYTLDSAQGQAIAFTERGREQGSTLEYQVEQSSCLTNPGSGGRAPSRNVMTPHMQVRRLTPRECERLQGFPDDYTLIPYRGKTAADSPRYKALGNSMAVPVMSWIGERIAMVDRILSAGVAQ